MFPPPVAAAGVVRALSAAKQRVNKRKAFRATAKPAPLSTEQREVEAVRVGKVAAEAIKRKTKAYFEKSQEQLLRPRAQTPAPAQPVTPPRVLPTDAAGPFTGEHDEDGFAIMKPMYQQPQGVYPQGIYPQRICPVTATPASAPASPTATAPPAPPTTPPPCATPPSAPQKEVPRKKRRGRGMRKLFKKLFSKGKPSRAAAIKSNTRTPCSRSEDEAWHQMVCQHQKQAKGKTRARQDGKGKGLALMNSKAGGRLKCWSKGK